MIDLKTTASFDDAFGRDKFIRTIYDYKYIVQIAFYEMILEEQTDKLDGPIPCWILAFEKQSPNRIAVYKIDDEELHDFLVKNNLRWLDRMIFKDLFDDEE